MKKLIITLLFMTLLAPAFAQEEDADYLDAFNEITPPDLVLSGPDGHGDGVVGALPSTVDVSALGGAVYSIPIQVPAGINGIQPNLSVVYNSQSGNGLLGWGWNIGGLSSITRVGSTMYHDSIVDGVDFDEYDRFALDGQRLIVLGESTYGSNGAEYKTEVDGMSKIVSYKPDRNLNGPLNFKVWTPEGLILEYGNTLNSRLQYTYGDYSEVALWLLNKVSDRNGNYMTYHYTKDGESVVVDTIYYTMREGLSGCFSVIFDYDQREDVELSFLGNHPIKQKHLLERIRVKWWDQEMWRYEFAYETGTGANTMDYYTRLSSISFSCGGVQYNPTQIVWGRRPSSIANVQFSNCQDKYLTNASFLEPHGTLFNNIKFSGDFNGDGLSDVIVVESALNKMGEIGDTPILEGDSTRMNESMVLRKMRVYLNEGNSKNDTVAGGLNFRNAQHHLYYAQPYYYYYLEDINWIYVCDFNGDGLDDIVTFGKDSQNGLPLTDAMTVSAYKSVILTDGTWDLRRVHFTENPEGQYWFKYVGNGKKTTLLTGDFLGRGRDDLIFAYASNDSRHFVYFSYDESTGLIDSNESVSDWKAVSYSTCDYNGDGKTEVWFAEEGQPGKLVSLYVNQDGQYTYSQIRQCFDSSCRLFTGDFNGDGKLDFLVYHPTRQTEGWEIVLGGVNNANYSFDVSSLLNNCTNGEDPGDYAYDFTTRESGVSMKYFVGLYDMDGDGKSDIVIRNDTELHLLYGPIRSVQGAASFAHAESVFTQSIGFNGEQTYGICVGNFLGQENASILQNQLVLSLPQHSGCYNVASIIDGMGNSTEFEYGYLVNNPLSNDNIFTLSNLGQNLGQSIYNKSLPIRAVKTMTSRNLYSEAPSSSQEYGYENALIHKFGRGFLGFATNTTVTKLADSLQSRTLRQYSTTDMVSHPFAVLKSEVSYGPSGNLLSESSYSYLEYWSITSYRQKVFFPALSAKTVDSYNTVTGDFFGRTIEKTIYTTYAKDTKSLFYLKVVAPQSTLIGTDTSRAIETANECEFQTFNDIDYYAPNSSEWVMRRPYRIRASRIHHGVSDEELESLTQYQYGLTNPFLVSHSIFYPGGDNTNANGLATKVSYVYDVAGNVTKKTLRALNSSLDARATEYEYANYRSPSLERNALGYETQTEYNIYGELVHATDCNGLVTSYWRGNHLGSTNHLGRPDGTFGCSAKRWAFDANGNLVTHAPGHAAYYTWDRSTDEPPVMVFYDASGRELRTVTQDMNGVAIYRDTDYDSLGRVVKVWEPYYWNQQRQYQTSYAYDLCHRQDTVYYPDGTFDKTFYSSASGNSEVTTVLHACNGATRSTTTKTNVVGWTTESTDNSGATVYYTYYADGKMKKARLNSNMEIQMEYDDAGNRTDIIDPNYGHQISTYNAFGELTSSTSPKGDVTEYRRDVLGRVVKRYDRDLTNHTVDSTIWVYGETVGEKGLLKNINFNNSKQVITYLYDTLCRPVTIGDVRNGNRPYQTSYGYDANGRINQITYPTGYSVTREYLNGRFYKVKDSQGNMLWQTLRENANGQIVSYKTGNLVMDSLTYDDATHLLLRQYANKGSTIIQNFTYTYDDFRNLATRTEGKYATPMTETFRYDNLDRLDTVLFNNTVSEMVYDAYGRMLKKTSEGDVVFRQALYNNQSKPHAMRGGEIDGDVYPGTSQSIAYTMHDKVKRIEQGDDILTIDYGYDRQRIGMTEWIEALQTTKSKIYVSNCEYVFGLSRRQRLTYLTGPMGVFAVYEELSDLYKDGDSDDVDGAVNDSLTDNIFTGALYYLHRDHLGSVTTVTNVNGAIVQELSYDAWGNLRNPYTWSGSFTGTPKFDRGYTGHEHLWRYGLINMNGRVYDPVMSCFLSVDTYVQDPENPQNFNRYAYCLNNPLRYVDPSGDFLTWSINQHGFSIGVNFTPAGVPLGAGINVSWANGGSIGFYAEAAYRVGGAGGGAGVGAQIAFDYNFATGGSCTASVFGYASFGPFSLGGSFGRNLTAGTNFWGLNAGVGLFYGSNINAYYGGGLSIGYGSGGWSFGINGFYDRMQKPYIISRETANANPDNVAACHQLEGSNDCVKEVLTWFELIKGGSLTDEEIQACIEYFTIEDYKKGECVIEEIGSVKDLNSLSNYGREKNMTLGYLDKEKKDYYGMCQQLFDAIDNGGFVMVNCESAIGHAVGVERITHTIRSNLWGNIISEYSFRVMNPAPVQYGGGYRPLSGYDIWSARNVGWLYIR